MGGTKNHKVSGPTAGLLAGPSAFCVLQLNTAAQFSSSWDKTLKLSQNTNEFDVWS